MSWSRAVAGAIVLVALLLCLPARAQAQPVITSGPGFGTYPVGQVELPLTATGGSGTYSWSIVGGTPPPGLAIRSDVPSYFPPGAATGLMGIATTQGSYMFTVQVSDGVSTAQRICTVSITGLVVKTPYNLADGFVGAPYSYPLAVSGFPNGATLTWAPNGPMPPGLSLGSDGVLSGTPTTPGFFNVPYSVSDGIDTIYWNHNLFVSAVQIVTDGLLPSATTNQSYSQSIAATSGSGSYTFGFSGGLPNGLSFNAGTISGTPTQSGRWTFTVTATDTNNNSYSRNMSLFVVDVPSPLPLVAPYGIRLDDCSVGVSCTRALGNWSGLPPFTWSASGLPSGMSIRSNNHVSTYLWPGDAELWGTATVPGDYAVTVSVTDATGASATNIFPLHVAAMWQTNNLPGGTLGAPYSSTLRILGGSGSYTAAMTGQLPFGLTFDSVLFRVIGTPLEGGSFNPQITFDDGQGHVLTVTEYFSISNAGNPSPYFQINNSDLGNAISNAFFSYQLSACCRPSLVWSLESGSTLPVGLSLSTGGLLSGTPTVAGQYTFVVRAADASNPGDYTTRLLTLRVTPVFITTNFSLPFANVSVPYSAQFQATGGTGPYTWTLAAGNFLPPGLSLTSNGLLAGTPSATGLFNFTVDVLDVVSGSRSSGTLSLAIYPFGAHPPLSIVTNGNFGMWSIGEVQYALIAQNGSGTYNWSLAAGTLPPGLAVRPDGPPWFQSNASGGLIGVATTPGTYSFTLRVSDGADTRDLPVTITIVPLTIKEWNLADAFQNVPYSYTLTPLGNIGAASWTAGCGSPSCDLPPGLTLNSATGTIAGTPTTPGFYNMQVQITADGVAVWRTINIGVYAIAVDTTTPLAGGVSGELPNATQGQPYSATFTASGGSGSYTFSSNSLPSGLSLNPNSGVISGTYNNGPGRFQFTITATDNSAVSYSKTFAIQSVASPAVLPSITPYGQRLDDCPLGVGWACGRGLAMSSGAAGPFTWTASGLPNGMSIRFGGASGTPSTYIAPGDAELWGTPTALGDFTVVVTVTDATGAQASNTFPLHISELELDGNSTLNNGTYGAAYSRTFRILGGTGAYAVSAFAPSANNRLPAGLTIDSAHLLVSGVPIETGSFSPDFVFTDSANPMHTLHLRNYLFMADSGVGTIQINTGSDLGYAPAGSSYNLTFSACCVPSYVWSLESGTLPTGTTLSAGTGQLSGTLAAGTYTFALRARNAGDVTNFAVRQFTLVVTPITQATGGTLPFGNVGVAYSQQLQVGGATNPTTFALAPYNVLPPGLTMSGSGLVSGTPTAPGQVTFTVIASDSAAHTLRMTFGLSIFPAGGAPPLVLNIGPSLGTFTVGQLTISLSSLNTSGGVAPYHYSLTPAAAIVPGMRVQDGQPLPTFFATQVPVPTAGFIGVVDTPGLYSTSLRVTDSASHTFDRAVVLRVSELNLLTVSPLPKATVGAPYSLVLSAAGGSGSYAWSGSGIPAGLSLDAVTGELHGTPTAAGSTNVTVTIADLVSGQTLTTSVSLTRNAFAIATTGSLPAATSLQPYSQQLSAPGCAGCLWSLPSGGQPSGLTLSAAGLLSGTPNGGGTSIFTIRATATGSVIVDKVFSLAVNSPLPQAVAITNGPTFGPTTIGAVPTNQVNAIGGLTPYTWSLVSGSLPPGISLVSSGDTVGANLGPGVGYLVGRAIQTGTYTFTLRVTDAAAATATRFFTWNISSLNLQYNTLPVRDPNNNLIGPALTRGTAYTQPLLAIGGTSRYTWTATLPAGLTLNASTGVVSGTPLDSGTFNVPVTIADDGGHAITTSLSLTIGTAAGAVAFGAGPALGPFAQGSTVSLNLSPTGGTAPYTVTALTPLPPGFALETGAAVLSNGTPGSSYFLAGSPLASGTFTFTLQLQDSASSVDERTFTLTVSPVSIFTSSPLSDGSVNAPYSAQLVAFDAAGAFAWSVASSSALPAGLTLSAGGLLSGTPTAAGNYSFNASIADSATGLIVTTGFSLKVSPLAISGPSLLPAATVLQPYSYTFAATGASGAVSWSFQNSALANGLAISPSGVISGTPLGGAGGAPVQITATASNNGNSVTRRFALPIQAVNLLPPSFALAQTSLPDGTVGQSYSVSLNPTGGLTPYVWSVAPGSSLPAGLSLLSGAQVPPSGFPGVTFIGGQPTAAGQYSFDLILTDANNTQARRTFALNVSPIAILSGSLRTANAGQAYAEQLTAVGGTAPYTFTASLPVANPMAELLPPGITLSSSGLLSGTTTSTGAYNIVVRAQDAGGNAFSRTYQLVVNGGGALRVTSGNYGDVYVGSGIAHDLFTSGNSTYTWTLTGGALPPGTFIAPDPEDPSATTIAVVGQPSAPGVYSYTLRATDNANGANVADHQFTLNVSPMQMVAPSFAGTGVPGGQIGMPYATTIKVAGGTPPYSFTPSAAGPVPPGLSLGLDGTLSGTPSAVGSFSVGAIVTDQAGRSYHLPFLTVNITPAGTPSPMAAVSKSLLMDDASVGSPYRFALTPQRGGVAPYSWTLAPGSTLPPGLAIVAGSNGVPDYLAGVPTTPGDYAFALTVADSSGQTISPQFALTVSPLTITPDSVQSGRVGTPYSATLAPLGGSGPYTIQAQSDWDMPPGLSLSSTGVFSGTPTAAGLFGMRVLVTDSAAQTLSKLFVVSIDNAAGESPAVTLAPRSIQLSYTQTFPDPGPIAVGINTTSGTPAFSLAVEGIPGATLSATSGAAPASASLDLHVTTLGAGTYSGVLAVTAPDAANVFDAIPIIVTVAAVPPCNYDVSPDSTTIGAGGGSGSVALATSGAERVATELDFADVLGERNRRGDDRLHRGGESRGVAAHRDDRGQRQRLHHHAVRIGLFVRHQSGCALGAIVRRHRVDRRDRVRQRVRLDRERAWRVAGRGHWQRHGDGDHSTERGGGNAAPDRNHRRTIVHRHAERHRLHGGAQPVDCVVLGCGRHRHRVDRHRGGVRLCRDVEPELGGARLRRVGHRPRHAALHREREFRDDAANRIHRGRRSGADHLAGRGGLQRDARYDAARQPVRRRQRQRRHRRRHQRQQLRVVGLEQRQLGDVRAERLVRDRHGEHRRRGESLDAAADGERVDWRSVGHDFAVRTGVLVRAAVVNRQRAGSRRVGFGRRPDTGRMQLESCEQRSELAERRVHGRNRLG